VKLVKNGPVYSNISNINRAFRTFGSPLHFDLIVDYVRTNWENGRGTPLENAKNLVRLPLNAKFYFDTSEEDDHYIRKEFPSEKLNSLYHDLKLNPNPFLFSLKTISTSMKEIYLDPRFDTISTEDGAIHIILTEWNLLNDLVYRYMMSQNSCEFPVSDLYREVILKYEIDDPNAYFFPRIDTRFIVSRKNMVSLKFKEQVIDDLVSVQVTDYIRENVVIQLPLIRDYLIGHDEAIKIRLIIQRFFSIQPHSTLFTTYFEAVKQSLSLLKKVFIINNDSIIHLDPDMVPIPEKLKISVNTTNFKEITEKVGLLTPEYIEDIRTIKEQKSKTNTDNPEVKERESLSYTLRYFDRIQETLSAHYFINWIKEGNVKLTFTHENEIYPFIFLYDSQQKILYGEHLSNFMIDYDLAPGQKLEFRLTNNGLTMKLGVFDQRFHSEQMQYEDLVRLAEIKHYGDKSLMQTLAELLILHPSGMHIRQIIQDIKGGTSYTESSIRNTLSTYPFFETIFGKVGYWRFNPRQWQKKYLEMPNKKHEQPKIAKNKLVTKTIQPLSVKFQKKAYATKNTKRKLTNQQFSMLPKAKFLELAWEYYQYTIYHYAKNTICDMIPLEDAYQQAFFALNRAYDNYIPKKGGSFYHYFKNYLFSILRRFKQDNLGIIRIPVHRLEELQKIDHNISTDLLLGNPINLDKVDSFDYTIYKTNYISFEELFFNETDYSDDDLNASAYSFFSLPSYLNNELDKNLNFVVNIEEPENCEWLWEEKRFEYQSDTKLIIENALKFLKEEVRNERDYEVILHRMGFSTGEELTLEEVAKIYGISRERVRQIESKSLKTIKEYKGLLGANV
jgi:RNA polymerase primary sigma factor